LSGFDPKTLSQFSVIRCPVTLRGVREKKRFVVIAHKEDCILCLKPTSQVDRFYADSKLLKGVLSYKVGQCACFGLPTVIQPDNQFEISYSDLIEYNAANELETVCQLPSSAKRQLIAAVNDSYTMNARQKADLLAVL
jgi:hypothetical protein